MYLLAFETSFGKFSISLFKDGKLSGSYASEKENDQAEKLIPAIEEILANEKITYQDLNYIAVGTGPGSFTGVRIGLATAKGISLACDAKLIGVSSFEASAHKTGGGKIYLNATRGEAFYQEFVGRKPVSEAVLTSYNGELSPLPDARSIGEVALTKLNQDSTLEPIYVRKPDAKFKIRRAELSDIPQLLKIHSACFPKPWTEQMFKDSLEHTIIADKLGLIVFQNILGEGELKTIAVFPEVQGKGVATYLMEVMIENCKKDNVGKIFLEVEESNARAVKLYEKFGFKGINTRKDYYGDGKHAIIMQLLKI